MNSREVLVDASKALRHVLDADTSLPRDVESVGGFVIEDELVAFTITYQDGTTRRVTAPLEACAA